MFKKAKFFLFFLLTACAASSRDYASTLQPWLGQSEERLQQSWGYPYNTFYITPNQKVISYIKFASRPMNGEREAYPDQVAYPAIATPDFGLQGQPQFSNYYCQTSFTIRDGVVVDYSFNGDDCVVTTTAY